MVNAAGAVSEVLRDMTPVLDERQRRLLAGAGARALGRGGVSVAASATGMSRNTVRRGVRELEQGSVVREGRVRLKGAGRKRATESDPELLPALQALVDRESRGDPESPLRWTCKSTRQLARTLTAAGHATSHVRVGKLLRGLGFRLQANVKTIEGKQHPDRDAQFRYINHQAGEYLAAGQIVLSVDTKKKELIGADPPYKNAGREWERSGDPEPVGVHDFPSKELGKAIPYGVYDVVREHRVRGRRPGPRHRRVRGRDAASLVCAGRERRLSGRHSGADLRRCGRQQRLPAEAVEGRARALGGRDRA